MHLSFPPGTLVAGSAPFTSVPRPSVAPWASRCPLSTGAGTPFPRTGFPRQGVNPRKAEPSPALLHAGTPAPGARKEGIHPVPGVSTDPSSQPTGPEPGHHLPGLVPPAPPERGSPPPLAADPAVCAGAPPVRPPVTSARPLTALRRVGARFKSS